MDFVPFSNRGPSPNSRVFEGALSRLCPVACHERRRDGRFVCDRFGGRNLDVRRNPHVESFDYFDVCAGWDHDHQGEVSPMRKKLTVVVAVLGLLATTTVALAAEHDDGDTVFNYGYDADAGVLVWNMSPTDGLYDCTLENGPLDTTYTRLPERVVLVDGLFDGLGDPVSFAPRPQSELAEGLIEAGSPTVYTGAEGTCGLRGGSVAGPNGQINHGMFLRLFNSMFDGPGRGCVNRSLAQSALGKDDQQLKVSDVDPESQAEELVMGTIEFETAIADCIHGNKDEVEGQGEAHGRPSWAGPQGSSSDRQRGKSSEAPGHNK